MEGWGVGQKSLPAPPSGPCWGQLGPQEAPKEDEQGSGLGVTSLQNSLVFPAPGLGLDERAKLGGTAGGAPGPEQI